MSMTYNPFSLEGKTILVTGASSGIGRSTAIECSKAGATVVLTARNEERLKETLSMLTGEGHCYIVADLVNEEQMDRLVAEMPIINGLVNNAGFNVMQLVPFIKDEDLTKVMRVNLEAPILLTHKVVKKKKIAKESSIVFTSSIAGKGVCSAGNSLYSASKGGMTAFIKNAALELAAKKIRCNAVLPGMVETPLIHHGTLTQEQLDEDREKYPLKRYGQPIDIANGAIYLLSDASSWLTGQSIVIDGGLTAK